MQKNVLKWNSEEQEFLETVILEFFGEV